MYNILVVHIITDKIYVCCRIYIIRRITINRSSYSKFSCSYYSVLHLLNSRDQYKIIGLCKTLLFIRQPYNKCYYVERKFGSGKYVAKLWKKI